MPGADTRCRASRRGLTVRNRSQHDSSSKSRAVVIFKHKVCHRKHIPYTKKDTEPNIEVGSLKRSGSIRDNLNAKTAATDRDREKQ